MTDDELVDMLYGEITNPGAVPSFEADEVIAWTLRRLRALGMIKSTELCKTCLGHGCDVCSWTTRFDALRGALLGDPNRFKEG
jgi:hypothetical protein